MGYATVSHVQAKNPKRTFTGSSFPTATQVIDYLEDTSAELDGILRAKGYSVPITAADSSSAHRLMVNFNALGAHAFAEEAAPTSDREENARKMWESAKEMLKDGTIELDAARDTLESTPRGPDVPSSFFQRDMEF